MKVTYRYIRDLIRVSMDRGDGMSQGTTESATVTTGNHVQNGSSEGHNKVIERSLSLEKGHHNNHNGEHFHQEEHHIDQKVSNHNKILTSFIAGGFAGAIAKTTIAPLDRTKINFQTSNIMRFSFKKAIQFLVKTYKTEGVLALWRGNSATMVRIVPYAAIQYTAHEQYKLMLNKGKKRKHLPPGLRALAGSLAGITATSCTYPLDFARARMAVTHKDRYSNLIACFRSVLKEEGWRMVMRGYTPTVFGSCIYSGISFFTYETLKILHAGNHFYYISEFIFYSSVLSCCIIICD